MYVLKGKFACRNILSRYSYKGNQYNYITYEVGEYRKLVEYDNSMVKH